MARGRPLIQIIPYAVLEKAHIDEVLILRDADLRAEGPDRLRRVATSSHPCDSGHAGVIPACHEAAFDQLDEPAFADDRIAQVEPGELYLLGPFSLDEVIETQS